MMNIKKVFKENTVASILFILVVFYILYMLYKYLNSRGMGGMEMMGSNVNPAYVSGNSGGGGGGSGNSGRGSVRPSEPLGQNEVFSSAKGINTTMQGIPSSCGGNKTNITNPTELLPKDSNAGWAQLNPSGQGMLANINLLKAGYNIGIDTIGSSLRNANLQIRSEPPNPQSNVSIWNQSTISPDFLRVPLEIGSGNQ
jgi:hypothetical protein